MKAVIQRVSGAAVNVDGKTVGRIGKGLLVLVGVAKDDTPQKAEKLSAKVSKMRIFEDENGRLSKSVLDIGGGILTVSNFTLCCDCSRGNRPDFTSAAKSDTARKLYLKFIDGIERSGVIESESGLFGADMKISAQLDGPVTISVDTDTL